MSIREQKVSLFVYIMHSILRFCSKITGSPGKPQIEAEDKCVRFVVGPRELTYAQYPATPSTAFVDGIAASIESAFGLQPGTYRLVDGTNCVWLLSQGLLSGTYTIQPEIRRTNTASYGDETADFRAYAYVSTIRGSEFVTCNIRLVISSALKPYTVKLEQNKVQLVLKPQPNWHLKNWAPASEEQMSVVKTQTNHEIIAKAQTSIQLGATGPHATFGLGGQYRFLYQTEVSEAAKNWQTGYTHYLNEEAFAPAEHLLERQHEWTMMLKDGISKLKTYVDCQVRILPHMLPWIFWPLNNLSAMMRRCCTTTSLMFLHGQLSCVWQATYSLCKEFELMYQQDPGKPSSSRKQGRDCVHAYVCSYNRTISEHMASACTRMAYRSSSLF